jgi:hypothetical protein
MYELPLYTIEKTSISGNKHVKIEDLKSNINSLKDANRPYLFIKLNGYLSEKRNKKDSLNLKEAKFQFFNRKPEVLDTSIVNSIRDKVSRYYSSIGYLNAQIRTKIDTIINNKVNCLAMAFLYRELNKNKDIYLLTRHRNDIQDTLKHYRISNDIFKKIIVVIDGTKKSNYVTEYSLFIDDSFKERNDVIINTKNVLCFDVDFFEYIHI